MTGVNVNRPTSMATASATSPANAVRPDVSEKRPLPTVAVRVALYTRLVPTLNSLMVIRYQFAARNAFARFISWRLVSASAVRLRSFP